MPIDTTISVDMNVIKRQAEKILQYKDLATEIKGMQNITVKVTQETTEAIGTIQKSFKNA